MHDHQPAHRAIDGGPRERRRYRADEAEARRLGRDAPGGHQRLPRSADARSADLAVDEAGRERGEGRPRGVPGDARPGSEGRPRVVREAQPVTPPADQVPTEGAIDRGETPSTENDPGQDL